MPVATYVRNTDFSVIFRTCFAISLREPPDEGVDFLADENTLCRPHAVLLARQLAQV
jgi:hypothetical protein